MEKKTNLTYTTIEPEYIGDGAFKFTTSVTPCWIGNSGWESRTLAGRFCFCYPDASQEIMALNMLSTNGGFKVAAMHHPKTSPKNTSSGFVPRVAVTGVGGGAIEFSELSLTTLAEGVIEAIAELELAPIAIAAAAISMQSGLFNYHAYDQDSWNGLATSFPSSMFHAPEEAALKEAAYYGHSVLMNYRADWLPVGDAYASLHVFRLSTPQKVPVVKAKKAGNNGGFRAYILNPKNPDESKLVLIPPKVPDANSAGNIEIIVPEIPSHTGNQDEIIPADTKLITPFPETPQLIDSIIIFPDDSGYEPIYVVLTDPRGLPGAVHGDGQPANEDWLDSCDISGSPIPEQVAAGLRGQHFATFDKFRAALWEEVSKHPELIEKFESSNKAEIQCKRSPFVRMSGQVGGRRRLEIHHIELVSEGGQVYDVDNMLIMTPRLHISIHSSNKAELQEIVMSDKNSISDYTEAEFLSFVSAMWYADFETEAESDAAVMKFNEICGHPRGSDLIYYHSEIDSTIQGPESLMDYLMRWREANGLPGFKSDDIDA